MARSSSESEWVKLTERDSTVAPLANMQPTKHTSHQHPHAPARLTPRPLLAQCIALTRTITRASDTPCITTELMRKTASYCRDVLGAVCRKRFPHASGPQYPDAAASRQGKTHMLKKCNTPLRPPRRALPGLPTAAGPRRTRTSNDPSANTDLNKINIPKQSTEPMRVFAHTSSVCDVS